MTGETAYHAVARNAEQLAVLSTPQFLDAIRAVEPLPQGGLRDQGWDSPTNWEALCRLIAMADQVGERYLVEAIALVYGRAPLDDPWDLTQSIRHGPEAAVGNDWPALLSIMLDLTHHALPGPRRWAVFELRLIADPSALGRLRAMAAADEDPEVRAEAANAISRLDPAAAKASPPARVSPFTDPEWRGDVSGRDGAEATRRIIRALISGALRSPLLDERLRRTGEAVVMTPGSVVYPPAEPKPSADGAARAWRATTPIFTRAPGADARAPSGLFAEIDLRRAGSNEVRARLLRVAPPGDIR